MARPGLSRLRIRARLPAQRRVVALDVDLDEIDRVFGEQPVERFSMRISARALKRRAAWRGRRRPVLAVDPRPTWARPRPRTARRRWRPPKDADAMVASSAARFCGSGSSAETRASPPRALQIGDGGIAVARPDVDDVIAGERPDAFVIVEAPEPRVPREAERVHRPAIGDQRLDIGARGVVGEAGKAGERLVRAREGSRAEMAGEHRRDEGKRPPRSPECRARAAAAIST